MKIIYLATALIFTLTMCSQRESDVNATYRITKVDSTGNYYLIYALRNDSLFKIVSKKNGQKDCKSIMINNSYDLQLRSDFSDVPLNDGTFSAKRSLLVSCFGYDSVTTICYDSDCVRDLFHSDNISGLCVVIK